MLYQVTDPTTTEQVASTLRAGRVPASGQAVELVKGWADGGVLASQLIGFDPMQPVKVYDQQEGTFVLQILESKTAEERLVATLLFPGLNADSAQRFITAVLNPEIYDIEDIRVQDTQTWIPAKDPKSNDILNGAFFKFANVAQSQTGLPVVAINFDEKGKEIFCNITEANIGKQMAIFVGGQLMTAPTIQDKICGGTAEISGTYDAK